MSFAIHIDANLPTARFYAELADAANAMLAGETNSIANAANLSALIYASVTDLNWAGFYLFDGKELVVGPFQGLPACVRIALGRGVCGTAAAERRIIRVDDVDAFDGHIACDSASRSELVIPLVKDEELLGVLDLDSPSPARFSEEDERGLSALADLWLATA
ncbi:MAG: GAF domain-containing protein [Lysobacterales bacterium]